MSRILLTAPLTLYVSRSGDDANDGLSWSSAKATVQGAVDELAAKYDTGLIAPVIQLSAEEHNAGVSLRNVPGAGTVIIQGNPAVGYWRDTRLFVTDNFPFNYPGGHTVYLVQGMYIKALTAGYGSIRASELGRLKFSAIDFGECGNAHVMALRGAHTFCNGDYTISGGALVSHFYSEEGGLVHVPSRTITIENEPYFAQAFVRATCRSQILAPANTFVGDVDPDTIRYKVEEQSMVGTNYAGAGYFPGGVAGVCDATSLYA